MKARETFYFLPRLNQEDISSLPSKLSQAKYPPSHLHHLPHHIHSS